MKKFFILSVSAFSFAAYAGNYGYVYYHYDCKQCTLDQKIASNPTLHVSEPVCTDAGFSEFMTLKATNPKSAGTEFKNKVCKKLSRIKLQGCTCTLFKQSAEDIKNNNRSMDVETQKVACHPTDALLYETPKSSDAKPVRCSGESSDLY